MRGHVSPCFGSEMRAICTAARVSSILARNRSAPAKAVGGVSVSAGVRPLALSGTGLAGDQTRIRTKKVEGGPPPPGSKPPLPPLSDPPPPPSPSSNADGSLSWGPGKFFTLAVSGATRG